jgi:1-acyl-sn-glycerol-3-phosphate acyltransferase
MSLSYLLAIFLRAPLVLLATALMGSINVVTTIWDKDGRAQLWCARLWARMLLGIAGARVRVTGLEKIDLQQSYVITPNHVSYMDTPALLANVPLNFRFLAKKGLFQVPFIGSHLEKAGHIAVPLDDPRAALKVLSTAGKAMKERGQSMLVFPEGGRSESGQMQPFKDGAAYLAIKGGVPVVPIAIVGIRDVLPMHSVHLKPGRVTLRIGDPIDTAGMSSADRTELTERLYNEILALQGLGHA